MIKQLYQSGYNSILVEFLRRIFKKNTTRFHYKNPQEEKKVRIKIKKCLKDKLKVLLSIDTYGRYRPKISKNKKIKRYAFSVETFESKHNFLIFTQVTCIQKIDLYSNRRHEYPKTFPYIGLTEVTRINSTNHLQYISIKQQSIMKSTGTQLT